MKSELHEINVTLSNNQKQKIRNAFINLEKIRLRLSKDALRGCDTLIVPTRFFEEMDNEDGIDAVVDEQTEKEMREEFESFRDGMREEFKNNRDEILEAEINRENWDYFGLFFHPAIDESMENKGIEFNLDYSLLNDLAKDFVKDNIKKLFK